MITMNEQEEQKKLTGSTPEQGQLPGQVSKGELPEAQAVEGPVSVTPLLSEEWTSIKRRWEGRIGHPRRLMGVARALLEDRGYEVLTGYDDESAPMRDTSYFQGSITARLDYRKTNSWLLVLGVTTLPLIMGYWIMKAANGLERSLIQVDFEGESYHVGAREERTMQASSQERSAYAERTGVISDIRIVLRAGVSMAEGEMGLKECTRSNRSKLAAFTLEVTNNLDALWDDLVISAAV